MAKKGKKEFNQQSATFKLREPINEGRVMFTIDDERIDSLFSKQFEADVDYIHDGPDVYYVTNQNDLEQFVDYIESLGLDADQIKVYEYFKEEGSVTGGEAYLPAMDVPSKKQNPFKEDTLSGYTQDKNFRPGHTKDKGGFQYKDLWGLNESEDFKETYNKSQIKTNAEELARVEDYLKTATSSQMSAAEDRIKKLRALVSLEKKYNIQLPVLHYGTFWVDYLKDQGITSYKELDAKLSTKIESKSDVLNEMNKIVDEVFSPEDYRKVLQVIEKIKFTNTRLYNAILDMISDIYPHSYGEVENMISLNEAYIPDNVMSFAKRKGVTDIVKKVASWAQKAGKRIVDGIAIGKGYNTLILDLTYQGGEIRINLEDKTISVNGEDYIYDYDEFVNALGVINENYSRFKNETKTRTKPEQFHQAVKSVKRKIEEINKLYEYMERLKLELSEGEGNLKYKKYTENAIFKIKEAVKALHIKTKKLK
jgi:hypothetical protein